MAADKTKTCKTLQNVVHNNEDNMCQVARPAAAGAQFSRQLENVSVDEGQTATLDCEVTGQPEPAVRWYKEGRPLTASQKVEMRKQDGRVRLILYDVKEPDSGRYTCIAQNHLGENSTSANVIVNGMCVLHGLLYTISQ